MPRSSNLAPAGDDGPPELFCFGSRGTWKIWPSVAPTNTVCSQGSSAAASRGVDKAMDLSSFPASTCQFKPLTKCCLFLVTCPHVSAYAAVSWDGQEVCCLSQHRPEGLSALLGEIYSSEDKSLLSCQQTFLQSCLARCETVPPGLV